MSTRTAACLARALVLLLSIATVSSGVHVDSVSSLRHEKKSTSAHKKAIATEKANHQEEDDVAAKLDKAQAMRHGKDTGRRSSDFHVLTNLAEKKTPQDKQDKDKTKDTSKDKAKKQSVKAGVGKSAATQKVGDKKGASKAAAPPLPKCKISVESDAIKGADGKWYAELVLSHGDKVQFCIDFMRSSFERAGSREGRKALNALEKETVLGIYKHERSKRKKEKLRKEGKASEQEDVGVVKQKELLAKFANLDVGGQTKDTKATQHAQEAEHLDNHDALAKNKDTKKITPKKNDNKPSSRSSSSNKAVQTHWKDHKVTAEKGGQRLGAAIAHALMHPPTLDDQSALANKHPHREDRQRSRSEKQQQRNQSPSQSVSSNTKPNVRKTGPIQQPGRPGPNH